MTDRPAAAGIRTVAVLLACIAALGLPEGLLGTPGQEGRVGPLDLIITGGRILDGSGNPWFRADVGIRDGVIVAVGDLDATSTPERLDAAGRLVVPGFVDLHSHADEGRTGLADPGAAAAPNLVSQGITTVVVGQDGRCRCPVGERAARYRRQGIGPNVVQLVGHGTIRGEVMGREARAATDAELVRMEWLVRQALREGAAGMSTGLEYAPGRHADSAEVIRLAQVVAAHGGFYISHQRSEGRTPMWWVPSLGGHPPDLIDAIQETIAIGEATGIPVVASHVKVKGADFWGASPTVTRLLAEARRRGVQAYADLYPYDTTGSDGNTVLIPRWALSPPEGVEPPEDLDMDLARHWFWARLAAPDTEADIRADIGHEIVRRGGVEKLLILESHVPEYVGRYLGDVAAERGEDPVDLVITFQLEGLDRPGGVALRGFSLHEMDATHYMTRDFVATSTDAGIALEGRGRPHPRFYGTYPRRLRRYALEQRVDSLAHAVRSATSLPAQIIGLVRRGRIHAGHAADLVILDLENLDDHATAMDPHRFSTGVDAVLINGVFVVREGELTGALPGRVLDGPGELRGRPEPDGSTTDG